MRPLLRTVLLFLLAAAAAMAVALALDGWAYAHVYDAGIYDHDLGRMLRVMGFLPLWILAAAALALCDAGVPARRWFSRALPLVLAPALSGGVGELLKLVIRRERPWAHAGAWVFRPWSDHPFSSAGLSTPSSHALVAFGAAFALARLFPRAWPVWYLLATGCILTRVASRAHFLSDVTLGALVAWAVMAALWHWLAPRAQT
jgi:membrane-associated phospholipid phosphatase